MNWIGVMMMKIKRLLLAILKGLIIAMIGWGSVQGIVYVVEHETVAMINTMIGLITLALALIFIAGGIEDETDI